jgi:peptide/nickel transport system substrate-binding protein
MGHDRQRLIGSGGELGRSVRGLALAALMSVIASACTGGGSTKPSPSSEARSASLVGGTLRVGLENFGGDYDPQVNVFGAGPAELGRCCLLRTLLSYYGRPTREGGTTLRPDLTTQLPEISPDGLTWTIHLRGGIHYAPPLQRQEIVAGDFIRAFERALSPSPPYLQFDKTLGNGAPGYYESAILGASQYADGNAETISGLEAPDDHTLRITLTRPDGDFAYRLALPELAPIPANPYDPGAIFGVAQGHEGDYGEFLVASGPYMIEGSEKLDFSFPPVEQSPPTGVRPESLTLVRNPSWNPSIDGLRKAYVDRIVFTPVDQEDTTQAVESGRVDLVLDARGVIPPEVLQRYATTPALKDRLVETAADSLLLMRFSVAVPPFDDPHVRKAVSLAIDKTAALHAFEKVRGGTGTIATHYAPNGTENNLLVNYDPYGPDHSGNLAAAKKEMALSKYDLNHDGICDVPACRAIIFPVRRQRPERIQISKGIKGDLAPLGIDLRLDVQEDGVFFAFDDPHHASPFDPRSHTAIVIYETNHDYQSAAGFFGAVDGDQLIPGGGNDTLIGASPAYLRKYGYRVTQVPSVDDRIRDCVPRVFEAQIKCWVDLDQYLMGQIVPAVPLLETAWGRILSDRIARFSFDASTTDVPMPALDQIALSPSAQRASAPSEPAPSRTPTSVPPIPDGVYRFTITSADLYRFDPNYDPGSVQEDTGTTTMTLSGGHWRSTQASSNFIFNPVNSGIYYGSGDTVTFESQLPPTNALTVPEMRWSFDGRSLHFTFLSCEGLTDPNNPHFCDDVRVVYEAHPWVKIG